MKRILLILITLMVILPYSCTKPSPTEPGGEGTGTEGGGNEGGGEEPDPNPPADSITYKIGDYLKEGLSEGIIVHLDETAQHGLMISLDQGKTCWSTEYQMLTNEGGEFYPDDGYWNMQFIKGLENWKDLYPAFAWCDNKNVLGLNAWYLPSIDEYQYIYASLDIINESLISLDCEPLHTGANDCYWTSMEIGPQSAYAFSFFYGEISSYDYDKKNEHYVIAMRHF
ncbi:MAG: DUF1566 domain-containing protein [Bacteroidales bacterium]|nr:DUF1566 domain-containing protein [Bacteroidales bacterium]